MQQEIDALKIALLQDDDEAGQVAAINVLGAALLLFERGVQALETIASTVDHSYDKPAAAHRQA